MKKNFLLLNSYHEDMKWSIDVKKGIYSVMDTKNKNETFYVENMDTKRHNSEEYYKNLAYFYKLKYKETPFDIIFCSDNNAFDFLKKYRDEIFGDVPVVFGGVNNFDSAMLDGVDNFTGVVGKMAFEKNIELILKLHPDTKNIFVINDYLNTGRQITKQMKKTFQKYSSQVHITYNENKPIKELRDEINRLPKDTVILYGIYFSDQSQINMSYSEVGEYILNFAQVPIYCLTNFNITRNVIGGYVTNGFSQGSMMANLGKKILKGRTPHDIGVVYEEINQYIFNQQALEKHGINSRDLPYNHKLIETQNSYYEQFSRLINTNIIIILCIVLLYVLFKYKQNIFTEKWVLKILVYGPILFLPLIIGTLIYNVVQSNQQLFKKEIETSKVEYLKEEQNVAYEEINKIERYINNVQKQMKNDLQNDLQRRVDDAYIIAKNIYLENKEIKTELEIKKIIIDALSKIRFFEGRGYYFINTNDAKGVLFNGVSKLDTLPDLNNLQDSHGNFIVRKQIEIIRAKKEGFVTHYINKLGDTQPSKKLSYVKEFEPFDWHIGTGEYLEDFNIKIQKEITRYVSNIRYGQTGYIFALSSDGVVVAHGDSSSLIGKNKYNDRDEMGSTYVQNIIKKALAGSSDFTKFRWFNKQTEKMDTKYVYARYFDEYQLIIGTGVFNHDIEMLIEKEMIKLHKKNEAQIQQIVKISLIVLLIVLVLAYMISTLVKQIFENYNKKLNNLNISLAKRIEVEIAKSKEKDTVIYQQAKMASMGEMIGNISHQWRQPLSVISVGATGLKMQKEYNILTDKQLIETCDSINDNAQYLSKTIDDFKNFIKNDRDRVKFDLGKNIKSFLSLVDSTITQHQLNVILDLDESIFMNSYPNELTQCFMNLFSNAKDALENKEYTKYFFISTKIDGYKVSISLKDNAGGIDENIIEKIFEPYFTTKHKSQGTGLGLSMTYKIIVEGMDGTINVYNRKYQYKNQNLEGAEFIITLDL